MHGATLKIYQRSLHMTYIFSDPQNAENARHQF